MPLVRRPVNPPTVATPDAAAILTALKSPDADERWAAARAAAQVAGGAAELIRAVWIESYANVREAMLTSLARIGSAESIEGLLSLLRSDDANLRTGALDALRSMTSATRDLLPRLLTDSDVDVRILSCELARNLPGDEATGHLCVLLAREQDANVCAAAIDVLTEVGGDAALPVLAECAERFHETPFLVFAIEVATDRITADTKRRG
jgi:HEAT repeat protein